jgi:hypothetical protein
MLLLIYLFSRFLFPSYAFIWSTGNQLRKPLARDELVGELIGNLQERSAVVLLRGYVLEVCVYNK